MILNKLVVFPITMDSILGLLPQLTYATIAYVNKTCRLSKPTHTSHYNIHTGTHVHYMRIIRL